MHPFVTKERKSMKKCILVLSIISTTLTYAADKDPVILKIGSKPITVSEFKYVYNKNSTNNAEAYTEKSLRDYMDLYIKFRLKVAEAEDLGMDTTKAFIAELNGYKKQLAQPYLTEKSVTEKLVKEAYERMQEEVRASHILLRVAQDADPKDTLAVYNRIMELRKRALAGEDFAKLAYKNSEDPSAVQNGGDLGYFTALQMVYPFEDGTYKTAVGEISMPVRSRFGYHIIKVHNRRKAQGEVKVAHIMIRYAAGTNPSDSIMAVQKINEIYTRLKKGENYESLCATFSEDYNSRTKGGELPPFSTGSMIPSFEEAAFKIQNVGEFGEPAQTPYGFHIIKLLDRKTLPEFKELESTLKSKVSKDSRSDLSKTYLINRLKQENKYTENPKAVNYIYTKADSTLMNAKFDYDVKDKNNTQVLFTLGKSKYTVNDFFAYVKSKQRPRETGSAQYYMNVYFKDFVNETLLNFEESNLEKKYNDYRLLVKEYRDGILLFSLMDNKVWTKAIEDTAGLKKFYQDNQSNYMWGKRAIATLYSCKDAATLALVKAKMNDKFFDVPTEKGGKFIFMKAKSDITSNLVKAADELVNVLNRDPNYVVELTATEEKGESSKVGAVAEQRLNSIKKYLVNKGIDESRIFTKSDGVKIPAKGKDFKLVTYTIKSTSISTLEKALNQTEPLTLQIKSGTFQKGDEAVLDETPFEVGTYEVQKNDRFYLVVINQITEPQPKTLEEARGLVISDYQNQLEKEWVESLRKKYTVTVNEKELKKLVK